ncbi:type II toxin-antitoxin system VapC family toxin [Rhizobium sp. TRM95796]|uniref:type II toxin-antitoxin system VapC family toxin n=1 Tax=Rhizobium sp. TRM95796 TaxID=2979862 RepID=UPI0021E81193|nr:type II toxin-antitoxin system VapC family toxin [Rhizobium sp. TRM95796]MCV3766151.1 type II toxin-antitoxin system VapC family toxin [Rhizobium sp. TRM95796]
MILLDTHVLVWGVEESDRLGPLARAAIDRELSAAAVKISAITPWEIAMLAERGRLLLRQELFVWLSAVQGLDGLELVALTPEIALESVRLPGTFHADPADRIIVASARVLDATLMTADRAILSYAQAGHVRALDARQ